MSNEILNSYADLIKAESTGRGEWLSADSVTADAQIVTWIMDDFVRSGLFRDNITGQIIKIEQAVL